MEQRRTDQLIKFEDFEPSSDWTRDKDANVLLVDLPGFKKEDLKVQVDSLGRLLISGESGIIGENKRKRFRKVFEVPRNSDINKISGRFDGEILFVIIPIKKPTEQPETEEIVPPQTSTSNVNQMEDNNKEKEEQKQQQQQQEEEKSRSKGDDQQQQQQQQQEEEKSRAKGDDQEGQKAAEGSKGKEKAEEEEQVGRSGGIDKEEEDKKKEKKRRKAEEKMMMKKKKMEEEEKESKRRAEELMRREEEVQKEELKKRKMDEAEQILKMKESQSQMMKQELGVLVGDAVQKIRNNKRMVITAVVAFSIGFYLSSKFRSNMQS